MNENEQKKRGRPKGGTNEAKPGSKLYYKRLRAKFITQQSEVGRLRGWTNQHILDECRKVDPAISLDMVNKAVAALVAAGEVEKREKGNKPGMRPETRARHLRVIDYRRQGEDYADIAFAEGLTESTVKVTLFRNHVYKGSIANYEPFDPANLVSTTGGWQPAKG